MFEIFTVSIHPHFVCSPYFGVFYRCDILDIRNQRKIAFSTESYRVRADLRVHYIEDCPLYADPLWQLNITRLHTHTYLPIRLLPVYNIRQSSVMSLKAVSGWDTVTLKIMLSVAYVFLLYYRQ